MSDKIDNMDERLTMEITLLSTKLVTAVSKQSELEELVLHLRKELQLQKAQNEKSLETARKYKELAPKYNKLVEAIKETTKKKDVAEAENSRLQSEVEDLTASLFDEANQMVSNASKETYNFKVKNKKLYEELAEKNTIIGDLQEQLRDLKDMFLRIENQSKQVIHNNSTSRIGTPRVEQSSFSMNESTNDASILNLADDPIPELTYQQQQLHSAIFSPNVTSVRLDLGNYNQGFKAFVYALIKPEFQFDLTNLKNLRYFRKIWNEELENTISTVPALPSSSLINRWSKGKLFWSSIVEGRAVIEPVKGINEVFKITYKNKEETNHRNSFQETSPIAIKDACGFCGESRNDMLEHSRLYYLKLLQENVTASNGSVDASTQDYIASYPLCNYCLVKLRNLCDFFAKLRLVRSNVYKFKQNSSFEEFAYNTNFPQFKRTSSMSGTASNNTTSDTDSTLMNSKLASVTLDEEEEAKLIKVYIMLVLIRNKIFWSKVGFWDNSGNIDELNLDEIHYETFISLTRGPTKLGLSAPMTATPTENRDVPLSPTQSETKSFRKPSVTIAQPAKIVDPNSSQLSVSSDIARSDQDTDTENETFADTSDSFIENNTEVEEASRDDETSLHRSNSSSKQFTKKMNKNLQKTIDMLKESMED
ncbi:uncharacterized protein RJT20DRAFT_97051 [Scheffersomyces xylosifermentans]|uniref:uncharacterized protein n=1 Tax=Scheffersomyces xylosifermentans TaxID=1304137 RepID=UPI00315D991E